MKKFASLICLFYLMCSPTTFAQEPNPDLWIIAGKGSDYKCYLYKPDLLKTEKVYQIYSGHKVVSVWVLFIRNNGEEYKEKKQFYLNPNDAKIRTVEWVEYDKNGDVTNSGKNDYAQWNSVIPETIGESIHLIVDIWATPWEKTK